jgi:hypothetical protein
MSYSAHHDARCKVVRPAAATAGDGPIPRGDRRVDAGFDQDCDRAMNMITLQAFAAAGRGAP